MPFYHRLPSRLEARQWNNSNDTTMLQEWTGGRVFYDPFGQNIIVEKEGGAHKRLNLGDYVIKLPNRTFDGMSKALFESEYRLETFEDGPISSDPTITFASVDEMAAAVKDVSERIDPVTDGEPNTVDNTEEEKDNGVGPYTTRNGPF